MAFTVWSRSITVIVPSPLFATKTPVRGSNVTPAPKTDIRREGVEQAVQIAGLDRSLERTERFSGLDGRYGSARPARGDVRAGAVGDLADRGGALVDARAISS